jgi:hypothetical protein
MERTKEQFATTSISWPKSKLIITLIFCNGHIMVVAEIWRVQH